jgi:hypothetical protein
MTEVYRFFGFGVNFINMMDTLGTGRTASIIYDDGEISEEFNLETGRPQGDGPSPLQYNMGEEIILLKIELDPRVASVFQHEIFPRFVMNLVPDPRRKGLDVDYNNHLSQESNRETDKADGFADDNSTATLANYDSLRYLAEICTNFSEFSGLKSNAEKTTLLRIGTVRELDEETRRIGFNLADEVTLLGMVINRDLSALTETFEEVYTKIIRMIEYWTDLSLHWRGEYQFAKHLCCRKLVIWVQSLRRHLPSLKKYKRQWTAFA